MGTAVLWALKNWRLVAAGVAILAVVGIVGVEHYRRVAAESELAQQKTKILTDANEAWAEREKKRLAFEDEVRKGLAKLTVAVTAARTNNETFKRQVNSNVDSKDPLSAADLDDLRLLKSGGGKAGGNTVRPAGQSPDL